MPDTNPTDISAWSKWITGVSLFSGFGCITVLVAKGVGEKNIINMKLAIVFFLVTILVAWIIQLAIALKVTGKLLIILIALEIVMFSLSTFYLAKWVWKFPPISSPPAKEGKASQTTEVVVFWSPHQ
ncbi:MAG TPA: hypothetical protein VK625_22325 [Flavitalea sp.]|nr:hypothetical protein [Flavitalea sp.]